MNKMTSMDLSAFSENAVVGPAVSKDSLHEKIDILIKKAVEINSCLRATEYSIRGKLFSDDLPVELADVSNYSDSPSMEGKLDNLGIFMDDLRNVVNLLEDLDRGI